MSEKHFQFTKITNAHAKEIFLLQCNRIYLFQNYFFELISSIYTKLWNELKKFNLYQSYLILKKLHHRCLTGFYVNLWSVTPPKGFQQHIHWGTAKRWDKICARFFYWKNFSGNLIIYFPELLIRLTYQKAFESMFPLLQNTSCGNHGSIPQMNTTGQYAQPEKKKEEKILTSLSFVR